MIFERKRSKQALAPQLMRGLFPLQQTPDQVRGRAIPPRSYLQRQSV